MVFSSFSFLLLFLPLVLLVNRWLSLTWSNIFLFLLSLLFYFLGEGRLVGLLILSISWNYGIALGLGRRFPKKPIISLGIAGNLLLLAYYKYFSFILQSLGLDSYSSQYSEILLPIGISFFTFQGISYLIDVYRQEHPPEKSFVKLGLYISFFPQLIAGPIVKYKDLVSYLSNRRMTTDDIFSGSQRFIRGLAKKILIADQLALVADQIFTTDASTLPCSLAWIGVLVYALQIYYDFSGYTDMAIGMGKMLGFKIPENFNHPYIAKSVREFWQRWHISLSSWFKDYLYIPLGGNKLSPSRTYINLLIVFFLTGLWHGASFSFILWGLLHGFFMIIERVFSNFFSKWPHWLSHLYLIIVVGLLWILFRIESYSEALIYFKRLFVSPKISDSMAWMHINPYVLFIIGIAILFSSPLRQKLSTKLTRKINNKTQLTLLSSGLTLCLLVITLSQMSVSNYSPFIYFRF